MKDNEEIVRNDNLLAQTYLQICDVLKTIDLSKKQFIWLHLPHVLKGRRCYMDDMDAWDYLVGFVRNLVGDDSIYLTADHGHMNMYKGKVGYGFDVYEPAIRIPLITPRIDNLKEYNGLTNSIDLKSIMVDHSIPSHVFVVSDSQYYAQPNRKNAVISERYKLIYNVRTKTEELYDLWWDPLENYNILKKSFFDEDRIRITIYDELYFYPYREEALKAYEELKDFRDSFWREPSWKLAKKLKWKKKVKNIKLYINNVLLYRIFE